MNDLITIDQSRVDAMQPAERVVVLAYSDKKISEYDAVSLSKALYNALVWITKDIGLRGWTESDMQYSVVRTAELLKRYYANFSIRDFRMAFEMSYTGELDEFLPRGRDGQPERGHYQNLNAEYICRILNAYKAKRSAILKRCLKPKETTQEMTEERKKELKRRARGMLLEAYGRFEETGIFCVSPIQEIIFYDILSGANLVPAIEVTESEQREVLGRVLQEMTMRGASAGEVHRKKEAGIEADDIRSKAYASARRKALEKAFISFENDKINLSEYV